MGKRFEKKKPDTTEFEEEEKKIRLGKILAGIGTIVGGFIGFLFLRGKSDNSQDNDDV